MQHITRKASSINNRRNIALGDDCRYQVQISCQEEEPEWDQFLAQTAGGHHVQTSLWAQAKKVAGWRAMRILLTTKDKEQIVGGAQLLLRPLSNLGAIGYVQKGPVVAVDDPAVKALFITQLQRVAKDHHIHYLMLQPPDTGDALADQLLQAGFQRSLPKPFPTATVLIDLAQDLDTIQARMKAKTRYNIRVGQRKGITVREGTEHDLATFHQILVATGQRQTFSVLPLDQYVELERILRPLGYFKLFLAEYQGEAISAMLAIPFNNTVLFKRGGWSGCHSERRPNEIMHWMAIQWAKAQGYRYYDFEGIDSAAAHTLVQGDPLPQAFINSVTNFKVGFGGDVVLLPDVYEYIYNPLLRWGYRNFYPTLTTWLKSKWS